MRTSLASIEYADERDKESSVKAMARGQREAFGEKEMEVVR